MKPTAFLIDTARAGIVDGGALTRAHVDHRSGAFDVFHFEPPTDTDL